jgi:hypothetical protein
MARSIVLSLAALSMIGCASRPALERATSLAHDVERIRNARFKTQPEVHVVDDDAVGRFLAEAVPPEQENLIFRPRAWAAFGVPAYREGKSGRPPIEHAIYSFEKHAVYLRRTHQEDSTIVHELEHAFQDQRFVVDLASGDEDQALARRAAFEGDAYFTENVFLARKLGIKERDIEELGALIGEAQPAAVIRIFAPQVAAEPLMARDTMMISFVSGFAFTAAVHARGGFAAVDATLAHPPESTEQVLHPSKYFAQEAPIEVRAPDVPAGFHLVAAGKMGEARIRAILAYCLPIAEARAGAFGWGGDRYLVVERDDHLALLWRTVWDTPLDAAGFYGALERVTRAGPASKPEHGDVRIELDGARVNIVRGLESTELERAARSLSSDR